MANIVALLTQYKNDIIAMGRTDKEKRFIEDSFTRWYFNSQPDHTFMPKADVVNKSDLLFGNKQRGCHFQAATIKAASKRKYDTLRRQVDGLKNNIYPNEDNLISEPQLQRLRNLYKGKSSDFEADKNKLLAIYKFIGMNSAHLSIPPIFSGIELFGSPLNTHNPYCSPFEFEKMFGSLGSFFNFSISKSKETLYTCNPPFDEEIMLRMAEHLDSELCEAKIAKTIIITIPVWDSASQRKLGIRDFRMDFAAFDLLMKSKYLQGHEILDRATFSYWDYYGQKLAPVSYTHLIILANKIPMYTIEQIKELWQKFIAECN